MCNLPEAFHPDLIKSEIRRRTDSWVSPVLYVLHNRVMHEEAETFRTHNMAGYMRISNLNHSVEANIYL
jgi:hypothetical protein